VGDPGCPLLIEQREENGYLLGALKYGHQNGEKKVMESTQPNLRMICLMIEVPNT
jgi:hypothetical protein